MWIGSENMTGIIIVFIVVGIPIISKTVSNIIKMRYEQDKKGTPQTQLEIEELQNELSKLKQRVSNLESIVISSEREKEW